jgi:hypothetical protein
MSPRLAPSATHQVIPGGDGALEGIESDGLNLNTLCQDSKPAGYSGGGGTAERVGVGVQAQPNRQRQQQRPGLSHSVHHAPAEPVPQPGTYAVQLDQYLVAQ